MKHLKKIICLCMIALPTLIFSQTKLTSLSVNRFLTHAVPTIKKLTIYGENLWPDYMTNSMSIELVKVHFKKNGNDQVIRQTSGNKTQMTVSFSSADWLTTPGSIEVYIMMGTVDGSPAVKTNSLWITVDQMPSFPPVIVDVQPKEFTTGQKRDNYLITILGNHFGEEKSTSVTIGGITGSYANMDIDNGRMLYWIPAELINTPGKYDVVVRTAFGTSQPAQFSIVSPGIKIAPIKQPMKVNTNVIAPPNKLMVPKITNTARPEVMLIDGAKVILRGNISSEADKTVLENYIGSLDNVIIVSNEFIVADNNANILITISGKKMDALLLGKIKTSINDKLKSLKIESANVVIEN